MGVRYITAPQVYVDDTFAYAYLCVHRSVEFLVDVVSLGPEDLSDTAELGGGGELVYPCVTEQAGVLQSYVEGMTWGIWDEVVLEILFPIVVIPERSMGETVINVGGQPIDDAGTQGGLYTVAFGFPGVGEDTAVAAVHEFGQLYVLNVHIETC